MSSLAPLAALTSIHTALESLLFCENEKEEIINTCSFGLARPFQECLIQDSRLESSDAKIAFGEHTKLSPSRISGTAMLHKPPGLGQLRFPNHHGVCSLGEGRRFWGGGGGERGEWRRGQWRGDSGEWGGEWVGVGKV